MWWSTDQVGSTAAARHGPVSLRTVPTALSQWGERARSSLFILFYLFILLNLPISVSSNLLPKMTVFVNVSFLFLPLSSLSPARTCSRACLLPGLRSQRIQPKPSHGSLLVVCPGLTNHFPPTRSGLGHADPGLHKNMPLWKSGHKISWRTPADCPWSLPLTTDTLWYTTIPTPSLEGSRLRRHGSCPLPPCRVPHCPADEEGGPAGGDGVGLGRAGGCTRMRVEPASGGSNANRASMGAPAAEAGCYVLRVKATTRGRKPPWKYTWQTVMAP